MIFCNKKSINLQPLNVKVLYYVLLLNNKAHIFCSRRRGRRGKQLQDGLKEKRSYWNLKEKAIHRTDYAVHDVLCLIFRCHGWLVKWFTVDTATMVIRVFKHFKHVKTGTGKLNANSAGISDIL
jgi:hypothetical protein